MHPVLIRPFDSDTDSDSDSEPADTVLLKVTILLMSLEASKEIRSAWRMGISSTPFHRPVLSEAGGRVEWIPPLGRFQLRLRLRRDKSLPRSG